MEKKITSTQVAIIKRVAQNVNSNFEKVARLKEKVAKLTEELAEIQSLIDEMEAPVKRITGGFTSMEIFDKVVTPVFNENGTPKVDEKTGYPVKQTKWVLKYPETIVPTIEEEDIPQTPQEFQPETL